jgi:hypothetical protein
MVGPLGSAALLKQSFSTLLTFFKVSSIDFAQESKIIRGSSHAGLLSWKYVDFAFLSKIQSR